MISKYIREQKRYSKEDLKNIFECSDEKFIHIIKRLKEYGIIKTVKNSDEQKNMSDLIDEDIETVDEEYTETSRLYVFTFVGIVIVEGRVLKCYPKYLFSKSEPAEELKQIIKVLQKYNSKEQIIKIYNDGGKISTFNLLVLMVYLLNDYYENGIYINTQNIVEVNGSGEILWEKTINENYPIISNNRPYYTEFYTTKRINDEYDYFKRLHECVLSICSRELENAELLDILGISEINLSDEEIESFGDNEYILYRLNNELNIQFNTRKQRVLKALEAYISHKGSLVDLNCFSLFGTNSFNLVWEEVCAKVFDSQLETELGKLELPVPLKSAYKKTDLLISIIDKPIYYGYKEDKSPFNKKADKTLKPDLISINKNKGQYEFAILDAKYYTIQLEANRKLRGQPGVGDITKQYLYQLAYRKFVKEHNFTSVKNCFLMPTEDDKIIEKGYVSMEMLDTLELEHIQLRQLPAQLMYTNYLNSQNITIDKLNL